MLTPKELAQLPERISKIWDKYELELIKDIAARYEFNGELTPTALYRFEKLLQFKDKTEIFAKLAKTLNKSEQEVKSLFKEYLTRSIKRDLDIIQKARKEKVLLNMKNYNPIVINILNELNQFIRNVTNSYVYELSERYAKAHDKALLMVRAGTHSLAEAVKIVKKDFFDEKQYFVVSPNGRKEQLTYVIERAVRTQLNRANAQIQTKLLDEQECDLVEVSSHYDARPEHALWQGQIYSRSGKHSKYKPFKICGLGTLTGLCGINCRHSFFPYFEGMPKASKEYDLEETKKNYEERQKRKVKENNRRLKKLENIFKEDNVVKHKKLIDYKSLNKKTILLSDSLKYRNSSLLDDLSIKLDSDVSMNRSIGPFNAYETTKKGYFVSQKSNFLQEKRNLDIAILSVEEAKKLLGIKDGPDIVFVDTYTLARKAIAIFDDKLMTIFIDSNKYKGSELAKLEGQTVYADDLLSTPIHELLHYKDELQMRVKGMAEEEKNDYLDKRAKKALDKLGITLDNVDELVGGDYARKMMIEKEYNEVFTEYRTKKIIERSRKK